MCNPIVARHPSSAEPLAAFDLQRDRGRLDKLFVDEATVWFATERLEEQGKLEEALRGVPR